MNQITTTTRGEIVPAEPKAKRPSLVLRPHLGPHLGARRFGPEFGNFMKAIGRLRDHPVYKWGDDVRARDHAEAEALARRLPPDGELERLRAAYAAAAEGQATRKEIASITAALLDAIPTYSAERQPGYLDALLFALSIEAEAEPFSAQALAGAAFRLMRAETFAPPPDKIIAAVREEQRRYASRADVLAHILDGKAMLREVTA